MHQAPTRKLTPTKSQRTEYRPQTAGNTRHATAIGTVAMPDVVSAGYLSQCDAVVHFGIVDLHSFTMVTNCLEVQVYDEANPFGSTERRSAAGNPTPVAVVDIRDVQSEKQTQKPFWTQITRQSGGQCRLQQYNNGLDTN